MFPTRPTPWWTATFSPTFTPMAERWLYVVMTLRPAIVPWSNFTCTPFPPAQPALTTVPAAAAPTGVPQGAARSSPEWSFQTCLMGWNRVPKRDVLRPCRGIDRSVPEPGLAATAVTGATVAVGTMEGTVRTVVSSPGASSGTSGPRASCPGASTLCAPTTPRGSTPMSGRMGAAVLPENATGAWNTGAMGTAARSLVWAPSETMRPMASTEDTDATSDLIPCAPIALPRLRRRPPLPARTLMQAYPPHGPPEGGTDCPRVVHIRSACLPWNRGVG